MSEIQPRVTGTEMEWAVGLHYEGRDGYTQAENEIYRMVDYVSKSAYGYSNFLVNGGRCYKDLDYFEYATGEEDTFIGTVASEIAGEQLVHAAVKKYIDMHAEVDNFQLLKRVHHTSGVSSGYHINLSADATRFKLNENDMYDLGLWAATCTLYTGAGYMHILDDESGVVPAIAQKTIATTTGFNDGTTWHKPLICTRNEPLSDPQKYHRVQIVGIDANISPWATWMAIGTASLCLRAIEQHRRSSMKLEILPVRNNRRDEPFARLAHRVAFDPTLSATTTLEDGTTIKAIDIQRELYRLASTTYHTDEEAEILKNWEAVLNDVDGDRSLLRAKTGWGARLEYMEKYAKRHDISLNDRRMLTPDAKWDTLEVADKLRQTRWSADMPNAELIMNRKHNPCTNTRAVLRSEAIREGLTRRLSSLEWSSYTLDNIKVCLRDPLMTSLEGHDTAPRYGYYEPDPEDDGPQYMVM